MDHDALRVLAGEPTRELEVWNDIDEALEVRQNVPDGPGGSGDADLARDEATLAPGRVRDAAPAQVLVKRGWVPPGECSPQRAGWNAQGPPPRAHAHERAS